MARRIQLENGAINSPRVKLDGHTEACFPFIPTAIEYILEEIFRNAFRYTLAYSLFKINQPIER